MLPYVAAQYFNSNFCGFRSGWVGDCNRSATTEFWRSRDVVLLSKLGIFRGGLRRMRLSFSVSLEFGDTKGRATRVFERLRAKQE